ncbi:MAG: phosphopyruvate hydratase [Candidatus Pacebacteria bacterium]|nr:phosphopyruvate hydratase [Candidatus Paceibacterota bacterium]
MAYIKQLHAREILDSRGNPTVEVECFLESGAVALAQVPSGASTGSHEAYELRDGDARRYNSKGVLNAVKNINDRIASHVVGKEFNQKAIDHFLCELDGTPHKKNLGANTLLGVSMAYARACANENKQPLYEYLRARVSTARPFSLPVPMMNILNGGRHATGSIDFQECMIVPWGAQTFSESVRWGVEVFYSLKKILEEKGYSTLVGDEGGFAPALSSNEEALSMLLAAIEKAGYAPEKDIAIAIDVAANELYSNNLYHFAKEGKSLSTQELAQWYGHLVDAYPICSIEDGFSEDDWDGFASLTESLGSTVQIIGDDLFVTNNERLAKGVAYKAANAILIKPNQIGTVSETLDVVVEAQRVGYGAVVSHRSGETEDTFIADLAVGLGVGQIKTGSLSRGERVCKYNQLLRIEEQLGSSALYAGVDIKKHIRKHTA